MTRRINYSMKKFCFLALALTITISLMTAPSLASANSAAMSNQQQPPPLEPQEAADLYGKYYAEKDQAKRHELAKEFLVKFPNVDPYWKKGPEAFIKNHELKQVFDKCAKAEEAYFATGGQNAANLNTLLSTCDAYLAKSPTPDIRFSYQLARATGFGVLAGFYKDTTRSNEYAEKSLKLIEPTAPPAKEWTADTWAKFRSNALSQIVQFQGLYKLRQTTPDNEGAIELFTKAAGLKEGPTAKDPNTYLLRAEATTAIYTKLKAEYDLLSDDKKVAAEGKELLNKIYSVVEKIANDYGRVVAVTEGKTEYKTTYDDAKSQTVQWVNFLNKDYKPDDLYKLFKGDLGAPNAKIKSEESVGSVPPTAPGVKGTKAAPVAAASGTSANSTTAKTPAKSSAKPKVPPKKRK